MAGNQGKPGLAVRKAAAERLREVLAGTRFIAYTDRDIPDPRDRALANRLVTLALRRNGQINRILDEALERGLPKRSGIFEAALRIAVAELMYRDESPAHSAIDLAVDCIKTDRRASRFAGLANAVLRKLTGQKRADSDDLDGLLPLELATRWRSAHGPEALDGIARALLAGPALDLTLRHDAVGELPGTPLLQTTWRVLDQNAAVADLPGYAEGQWWVQDTAAAIPACLMPILPGDRVADLCAAPGGKTAQLCDRGARVTAVDDDPKRLETVRANLERLGFTSELVAADATQWGQAASFDHVLLDAPCTATGTLRRHPEVIWHRSLADVGDRAGLQRRMLDNAARLVRPGGTLIYCTCSLEPEEGEEQAPDFLDRHPRFSIDPVRPDELEGWAEPITDEGFVRTLPGMNVPANLPGTLDGFFVARFKAQT